MVRKRPLILVSNDDGFQSKGVSELIRFLRPIGDIIVMAPDSPRSAQSAALTITTPITFQQTRREVGLTVYKCTGTPADCVKLALNTVLQEKPDLVIGGINHGDNSGINVHYSGTMGVAIEGCISGIPSIGFSLCNYLANADFRHLKSYIQLIVRQVLNNGLPPQTCLNVNFPDAHQYNGIKICEQTHARWIKEYIPYEHPYGPNYYWLTGEMQILDEHNENNDAWALTHSYVAITPVKVDMTDHAQIKEMQNWDWALPKEED